MMRTFDLYVTAEEVAFLANNLPAGARWPEPWDAATLAVLPGGEPAGGLPFRLKVIALRSFMARTFTDATPADVMLPLEVTEGDLWFLDFMCNQFDYSKHVMGRGSSVFTFVKKVWALLLAANANTVDPRYLPGVEIVKETVAPEQAASRQKFLDEIDALVSGAGRTGAPLD